MDAIAYNWTNLKKLPNETLKWMLDSKCISNLFQVQIRTVLGMRNENWMK